MEKREVDGILAEWERFIDSEWGGVRGEVSWQGRYLTEEGKEKVKEILGKMSHAQLYVAMSSIAIQGKTWMEAIDVALLVGNFS